MLSDEATVRRLAVANAAGRIAIGVGFLIAPRALGRRWFGTVAEAPAVDVLIRMLAVRDLVIGAGTLRAMGRGESVRAWFALALAVESVDGLTALGARRHLPKWTVVGTVAAAGLGAASDAHLAYHLDRRSS